MKKRIKVIFAAILTIFLFGMGNASGLSFLKNNVSEKDSVVKVEDFPPHIRFIWDSINDEFLNKVYHPFFNKRGIHFDCDKCEHIAIELIITIDSSGIVSGHQIVYEQIKCDKLSTKEILDMKELFIDFFSKIRFPQYFCNKNIQFRIRPKIILKC
jgi:hypothetical protein